MSKRAALPNFFTITNLFCGFLAVFYASQGRLVPASWLIVVAGFLDAFDGKIARLMDDGSSDFGLHFDSLADVCSFGVAPAVIMLYYFEGLVESLWVPFGAAFLFLLCGALRLARFNASRTPLEGGDLDADADEEEAPRKADFVGLPIPVAAATLAAYVVFTERVWDSAREPHMAISLMAMLAFLMVSTFDYPAFPRFSLETGRDRFRLGLSFGAIALVVLFTEEAFFPITMAFCLSGALKWAFHLITGREVADVG